APVGVSVTHQAAELTVRGAAEATRSRVRGQRETLLAATLSGPLAAFLAEWPATGGSSFERLQQVLRRVPQMIRQLEERVMAKAASWAAAAPPPPPAPAPATQPTGQPTASTRRLNTRGVRPPRPLAM